MWHADNLGIREVRHENNSIIVQSEVAQCVQKLDFKLLHIFTFRAGLLFNLWEFDVTLPNIPSVLYNVMCTGNETSLLQCSHNGFIDQYCSHDDDIVLKCIGKHLVLMTFWLQIRIVTLLRMNNFHYSSQEFNALM